MAASVDYSDSCKLLCSAADDKRARKPMQAAPMAVKRMVLAQIRAVASEHNQPLAELKDDLLLLESGLDSLCLAILIARLDDVLGVDPFAEPDVAVPETLNDLISVYENASSGANFRSSIVKPTLAISHH